MPKPFNPNNSRTWKILFYRNHFIRTSFHTIFCLQLVVLLFFLWHQQILAAPIAPDKQITVISKDSKEPLWKQRWDMAREQTNRKDFLKAIELYNEVLKEKPHIEEVKWELSKVLIAIKDYEKASILLKSLIETDGDRIDYLISAGNIALFKQQYEQAGLYFGQAYEQDPGGKQAREALVGLIESLKAQRKTQITIPLIEQLYQRGEITPELLLDLARYTKETGILAKSQHYFSELVTKYRVTTSVLKESAYVIEEVGNIDEAALLWKRYIEENPSDLEFRQKYVNYLLEKKRFSDALPDLLVLLDNNINRENLLLVTGKIYLFTQGRPDKALGYFERFRDEFPEGKDVSSDIANIQLIMANDLLSIVENDGVWMLWRDLAKITPDRIGIYRAMADLLENLNKEKELIEVLELITIHDPDDIDNLMKLSKLHMSKQEYSKCLTALKLGQKREDLPPSYYLVKASCEDGLGDDRARLQSYVLYLETNPGGEAIRKEAIRLAGDLGLVNILQDIYSPYLQNSKNGSKQTLDMSLLYIDALMKMQLYSQAYKELKRLIATFNKRPDYLIRLNTKRARLLLKQGFSFKSEQLLLQTAALHPLSAEVLLALGRFYLAKEDDKAATIWLYHIEQNDYWLSNGKPLSQEQKSELFYQNLQLLELSGQKQEAINKASAYLATRAASKAIIQADGNILLFLAINHYLAKNYNKGQRIVDTYKKFINGSKQIKAINTLLEKAIIAGKASKSKPQKSANIARNIADALNASELLVEMHRYSLAKEYLTDLREEIPDSLRVMTLTAITDKALLAYDDAYSTYQTLHLSYPNETFFLKKSQEIEYLQGNPKKIIDKNSVALKALLSEKDGVSEDKSLIIPGTTLLLARSLWTEDRWEDALKLYEILYEHLNQSVAKGIDQLKKTPGFDTLQKTSLWGTYIAPDSDKDILNIVMEPSFFSRYLQESIAQQATVFYEDYRWLQIISKEKDAKKSLYAAEFYQAEQTYKELLDVTDKGDELSFPELATIYSRLGRYAKETELLEKIKEKNIYYPVLEESAKKNKRQRQPQLSFDGAYKEELGRNGFKDITQKYTGIGLHIQPTLFQEIGFDAARNEYGNSSDSTLLKSYYILGNYSIIFNDYFQADINLGVEDFDTDGKTFILYDIGIKSYLEEHVGAYLLYKQYPVDDTIQSLAEGIYRQDVNAGLTLDYLPFIFLGFDFNLLNYSDNNQGKKFHLWSSYRLFGKRSTFDLAYHYEKFETSISNVEATSNLELPEASDVPYWSPGNYWKHLLAAEYRLELWPTGRYQSGTSYVSALYGIGYESETNLYQQLGINFFLEIIPSILLKGTFAYDWSDDYDRQETFASFVYRW